MMLAAEWRLELVVEAGGGSWRGCLAVARDATASECSMRAETESGSPCNRNGAIMVLHMPSLTIKQVPEELVDRIRKRAELTGRSMNREIIACLQQVVMPRQRTAEQRIAESQAVWDDLRLPDLGPYDPAWKREGSQ